MRKQRIDIEYPLATKSFNIAWDLISTAHGLERWIADHVTEEDGVFTFTWGEPWTEHDTRKAQLIDSSKHFILKSAHPSPLSAYRGFFGNHHFSLTNMYLQKRGESPIKW